jgi:hypothetical protein
MKATTKSVLPTEFTLRDLFAAQALTGLIAAYGNQDGDVYYNERDAASSAYALADAMLAERAKEKSDDR